MNKIVAWFLDSLLAGIWLRLLITAIIHFARKVAP